jgi:transposase-like protein
MTNQKNGVSALGFQRTFEIGSYRTAWTVLQKLRNAMVGRDRKPLTGEVEVDETLLGGKRSGKRGRGAEGKELVLIAAEINGNKTGRVRIQRVPDASGETLEKFIKANIEGGSVVITDGWRGYNGVKKMGYRHERVVGDSLGKDEVLPRVHRVASLLKRWLLGTHHGRVEVKHLDRYLGEFNFRFNRRTSRSRGLLFYRLLQNAVQIEPEGYREIVDS